MLSTPPSYSNISMHDPPEYSLVVTNRPPSPPPEYADAIASSSIIQPLIVEDQSPTIQRHDDKQRVEHWCVFTWILFLISLALLYLILSLISMKCTLPNTSLTYIRVFFCLHIIFLIGTIIYCCYKFISKCDFTLNNCFTTSFAYSTIPLMINVPTFFNSISDDMGELNMAIRRPLSVTDTYPCSLLFYRLVFMLTICHYISAIVCIITIAICIVNRCPNRLRRQFD